MESMSDPAPLASILIVEDEELDRELLATTLSWKYPGVALHFAFNGMTGLQLFLEHEPDIVITDINMPEMGGFQLVVKIRSVKPETKLIVLTGCTGEAAMKDSVARDFKIDHFILKPVGLQELFAAIEQCLVDIARQRQ